MFVPKQLNKRYHRTAEPGDQTPDEGDRSIPGWLECIDASMYQAAACSRNQWDTRRYMNIDHLTKFEDEMSELIVG